MNVGKLSTTEVKKTYSFNQMRVRNGFYVLTNQVQQPLRLFYKDYDIELLFTIISQEKNEWVLNSVGFHNLGDNYKNLQYEDFDGELTVIFKGNK